jgi:HlyD family secretion protein
MVSVKIVSRTAVFAAFIAVAASLLPAAGWSQDTDDTPQPAQQFPWAAIAKGRIDIEGGTIRLAAQREGLIKEVLVEEGDAVAQGQVLARLDTASVELGIAQAEAEAAASEGQLAALLARLKSAKREAARLKPLARSKAIPQVEMDQANDLVATTQAELEAARLNVKAAKTRIDVQRYEIEARTVRSPLAGRIVRRSAKPGDGTATQTITELFLLAPDAPRIVRAELDEQFVDAVKTGQTAEIVIEFDQQQVFAGSVLRIGEVFGVAKNKDDPSAAQDTRVVELIVGIENGEALRIGQRVIVKVRP